MSQNPVLGYWIAACLCLCGCNGADNAEESTASASSSSSSASSSASGLALSSSSGYMPGFCDNYTFEDLCGPLTSSGGLASEPPSGEGILNQTVALAGGDGYLSFDDQNNADTSTVYAGNGSLALNNDQMVLFAAEPGSGSYHLTAFAYNASVSERELQVALWSYEPPYMICGCSNHDCGASCEPASHRMMYSQTQTFNLPPGSWVELNVGDINSQWLEDNFDFISIEAVSGSGDLYLDELTLTLDSPTP